jgi:hypothetical protein
MSSVGAAAYSTSGADPLTFFAGTAARIASNCGSAGSFANPSGRSRVVFQPFSSAAERYQRSRFSR